MCVFMVLLMDCQWLLFSGVRVFVVDTGVRWGHDEFSRSAVMKDDTDSRVSCGYDAFHVYDHYLYDWDNGCYDGVGHGTYVAAIVGGAVYVRYAQNTVYTA